MSLISLSSSSCNLSLASATAAINYSSLEVTLSMAGYTLIESRGFIPNEFDSIVY